VRVSKMNWGRGWMWGSLGAGGGGGNVLRVVRKKRDAKGGGGGRELRGGGGGRRARKGRGLDGSRKSGERWDGRVEDIGVCRGWKKGGGDEFETYTVKNRKLN
jgi:hypothetical protein